MLWLRLDTRLLADWSERSWLLDLFDDWRSGMTTTGMPPLFLTSRRALWLDIELAVEFDA